MLYNLIISAGEKIRRLDSGNLILLLAQLCDLSVLDDLVLMSSQDQDLRLGILPDLLIRDNQLGEFWVSIQLHDRLKARNEESGITVPGVSEHSLVRINRSQNVFDTAWGVHLKESD